MPSFALTKVNVWREIGPPPPFPTTCKFPSLAVSSLPAQEFASDQGAFFSAFSEAYVKMTGLGVSWR